MDDKESKDVRFKVNMALCIDEKRMSMGELRLIEGILPDLIRWVLDDEERKGNRK